MGDRNKGFESLEKAYQKFDGNLYQMTVDYELDAVRSDPRYLSMINRIGLKQ
jgi:hypothetical protein